MEQSTTLWKLSGGLSPASSASELGLQKEVWAASHILHHEMVGWSQPCLKLYTVPTQTFPSMHGTSFSRHSTVVHKSDSSLYPALMLQTWKNKSVLELPETRNEAFSVERWMQAIEHSSPCRWPSHQKRSSCLAPTVYLICRAPGPVTRLFPAQLAKNRSDVMTPFFAQMTFVAKWGPQMIRY